MACAVLAAEMLRGLLPQSWCATAAQQLIAKLYTEYAFISISTPTMVLLSEVVLGLEHFTGMSEYCSKVRAWGK